jgi:hypothetical protein
MSINLETPRLNPLGQIALGGISSLLVNGGVHPISTIQSCMMAGTPMQRVGLLALYRGFGSMFGTDWAAFATAYLFNDALQGRLSELNASIAAGLISAPVICVGEGLTRNRQVNALPYVEIFQRAVRPAGLATTALREIPFTVAVFYLSPLLQRQIAPGTCPEMMAQACAGILAGAVAGFMTSPVELIKTRVQTSETPLTMAQVVRSVAAEGGIQGFFRGGAMRTLYVGLATAGMNVVKNTAPHFLPNALRIERE